VSDLEPLIGKHHPLALKVRALIEPVVRRRGLELVDIQYGEGGGPPALRVYADGGTGITISVLEELSGVLSDLLDAEDPLPGKYTLEVSSPGVDRPLTKRRHYEAATGQEVAVRTDVKVGGSRTHRGILAGISDTEVFVQVDGTGRPIPIATIRDAHLVYHFAPGGKPPTKRKPPRQDSPLKAHRKPRPTPGGTSE
jgi:ribosome maturation factor RimP